MQLDRERGRSRWGLRLPAESVTAELPEISPWGFVIALFAAAFLAVLPRKDREKFLKALEFGRRLMLEEGKVISIRGNPGDPGLAAREARNRTLAANWVGAMVPVLVRIARLVEEE